MFKGLELYDSDSSSDSDENENTMEGILQSLGYNEKQIQDAVKHCKTVEEAILYLPATPKETDNHFDSQAPEPYCTEVSEESVVDLVSDESSSEEESNSYSFEGDRLYLNHISEIHRVDDMRYVSLDRLFSTTNSLQHDSSISHIFMTSFVYSDSILESICSAHPDAEITFATHLDPSDSNRDPVTMAGGNHLIVFPPFRNPFAYGCFHMKTIMIRFPDRLRVVFSSSNLWIPDWTKWSQGVWMQDFFNCKEGNTNVAAKKMDFEFRSQLISLMRACKCPEQRIFNLLSNVYFENVRVRLVLSIPNTFEKRNMNRYGHLRLREIIHDLNEFYEITKHPVRTFAPILSLCSSVGSPSTGWLQSILRSCNGGMEFPKKANWEDLWHIVFPTSTYVEHSRIGVDKAGSLIFSRKTYAKAFFRNCLKRYNDIEGRENTLPHVKYLMNVPLKNQPRLPWVYVGSHNFTRSAWGALMKGDSKFTIMNYESGVVLLPKNFVDYFNGDLRKEDYDSSMEADDYCTPVDLAFNAPCLPYREDDIPFLSSIVCL